MNFNLYGIYDTVDTAYQMVTYHRTDQAAIRAMKNQFGKMNINMNDIRLMKLGTFDDETGEIIPLTSPTNVAIPMGEN